MEYRELDYKNDLKEVVFLIKNHLQPKYSEEILKWKHLDSPFGKSLGLVATIDGKIVGVVFAMLYVFQDSSGKKIKSIRFFDACTEPDQRGKGIFKSLMEIAFEVYKDDLDFSFSNPNVASLKGHLRVGYEEPDDKIYYRIGLIQPYFGKDSGDFKPYQPEVLNEKPLSMGDFYLAGNHIPFLNWRYREQRYNIFEVQEHDQANYIVYRIEKKKGIKTIVLCDFFGDSNKLHEILYRVCRRERTFLIYYLENQLNAKLKFLFSRKYKKAVIVFKNGLNKIPYNLVVSLGDLEGRL